MLVVKLRAPHARRLGGQLLLGSVLLALSLALLALAASTLALSEEGPWAFASGGWRSIDGADVGPVFERPGAVRVGWQVAGYLVVYRDRLVEQPPTDAWLYDLAVLPNREVVVVGEAGVVLRRSRTGDWRMLSSGGPALRSVATAPSGVLYAAGDQGVLLRIDGDAIEPLQEGPGPTVSELRVLPDGRVVGRGPERQGAEAWLGWVALAAGAVVLLWTGRALARSFAAWRSVRWFERHVGPAHARVVPVADATRVLFASRRLSPTGRGRLQLRLRILEHRIDARVEHASAEERVDVPAAGEGPLHIEVDVPVSIPDGESVLLALEADLHLEGHDLPLRGEARVGSGQAGLPPSLPGRGRFTSGGS